VEHRDHHLTIFVPSPAAEPIEAVRRRWDPVMAAQIAAHVTVVYPREAPRVELLAERVRAASRLIRPFRLRLGAVACFERPEDGVYVAVEDVEGGYRRLREQVLRPPFRPVEFPPHVTLVHPRTSAQGRHCWNDRDGQRHDQEFTVHETAVTGFDGRRWVVLMTFTLGQGA
jgi:2'-5' RNA ligase